MIAARIALTCYAGEDYVATGTHKVSSAPTAEAVDITGWTITATIKARPTDTVTLLTIEGDLLSPTEGTYTIALTAAQSKALGVGVFAIDVWRMDLGAKSVLAKGTLSVNQPVRTV